MFATVEYASTTSSTALPDFAPHAKRRRDAKPKGLWRARLDSHVQPDRQLSASPSNHHDHGSTSHCSPKRPRLITYHSDSSDDDSFLFASTRHQTPSPPTPPPERESRWDTLSRLMDTTTTAYRGTHTNLRSNCDFDDWEDLKELFTKAAEQYECGEAHEALPLLRGVVHECHRFLICYPDPSILFSTHPRPTHPQTHSVYPSNSATPDSLTPEDEHERTWDCCGSKPIQPRKKCTCVELPTAFHAILGTALFLFGNLIAQEPSLALAGEPDVPTPYWFAALDVFETGENLPSRTSGYGCEAPEDWRMAIVWGRTLVCIADETLTRSAQHQSVTNLFNEETKWPRESPFSTIAARRPPVTRRMSMASSSAHDLMILAMDQFSRGIFHMPHQQTSDSSFSRAKELFTLASEVLLLAEKMDVATERQYWASWADSVFNQMKMEADMDQWRGPITRARGKCWLTVGSARVEELETALEAGDYGVLQSRDAEDARRGLTKAIEFFERAKGSASMNSTGLDDTDWRELSPLLTEALLTLANLTSDEQAREALYTRAEVEGGNLMDCD